MVQFDSGGLLLFWLKISVTLIILLKGAAAVDAEVATDSEGNPLIFKSEDQGHKCSYFCKHKLYTSECVLFLFSRSEIKVDDFFFFIKGSMLL